MAAATAADQSENLVVVVGEGQAVAATTAAQQSVWVTEVWISLAEKEREGRTSSAKNPQLLQKQQLLQLRHDHHDSRAVEKNWGEKDIFHWLSKSNPNGRRRPRTGFQMLLVPEYWDELKLKLSNEKEVSGSSVECS